MTIEDLPKLNAVLNSVSAVLLVGGFVLIKLRRYRAHAGAMLGAFGVSAAFLASYLIYHAHVGHKSSGLDGRSGVGVFYFSMLLSHLILAMVMVPMILMTLWRAVGRQWGRHKRMGRPTVWIWLYVSVTGVGVYWMLYNYLPGMGSR